MGKLGRFVVNVQQGAIGICSKQQLYRFGFSIFLSDVRNIDGIEIESKPLQFQGLEFESSGSNNDEEDT